MTISKYSPKPELYGVLSNCMNVCNVVTSIDSKNDGQVFQSQKFKIRSHLNRILRCVIKQDEKELF